MTTPQPRHVSWLPIALLLALFLLVVTQRAWMSDDAFITLRTVDNFVARRGLVYNVGERVQSYTHPLWLFILSVVYYFTREPFYTTVFLSIGVSFAAVLVLAFGFGADRRGVMIALLALTLSNAYVDYSTSGLENPLTHLLWVAFLALFWRLPSSPRKLFLLSFVAALGVVNRMDTGLLYLPILMAEFFLTPATWRRRVLLSAAGMAPFLLWGLFSLVYYGIPVPNTAIAKLNIDVPIGDLRRQGAVYLMNSLRFDSITLLLILTGLVVAVLSRERRSLLVALGTLLYLVYLVNIGGDFMAGRFLTAPLLGMAVVIAVWRPNDLTTESVAAVLGLMVIVGLLTPWPTLRPTQLTDRDIASSIDAGIDGSLVANERLYYIDNNLAFASQFKPMPAMGTRFDGVERRFNSQRVEIWKPVGLRGYYAGPGVHVIDYFALTDPLLARLPPVHGELWRVGHFLRNVPEGYLQTLATGENQIVDPALATFYDQLSLVTRGPVWSVARWREIWRFNTGYYDGWFDEAPFRFPGLVTVAHAAAGDFFPTGVPLDEAEVTSFGTSGIDVALATLSHAPHLQVSLDGSTRFVLWFLNGNETVGRVWLDDTGGRFAGQLVLYEAVVPEAAVRAGYDRVRVIPRLPQEQHALGHLDLLGEWPDCGGPTGCVIPLSDPRAPNLLRDGWATPESWGVWSDGLSSGASLFLVSGDTRLVVRAFPHETLCEQTLAVRLNGLALGQETFAGCGESELTFALPRSAIREGLNDLRFEYGATVRPGQEGSDLRQLGVGFVGLRLEPVEN